MVSKDSKYNYKKGKKHYKNLFERKHTASEININVHENEKDYQ